jgi:hypothetical protein
LVALGIRLGWARADEKEELAVAATLTRDDMVLAGCHAANDFLEVFSQITPRADAPETVPAEVIPG